MSGFTTKNGRGRDPGYILEMDADDALVKKARNGDMDAFEELVRKYESKVYGITSRMLSYSEDAKDAAQDTFLKAYRSINNFRGDSKFSTWLYRITNNVCLDYLRKHDRRALSLSVDDDGNGESRIVDIASEINVEEAVEGAEFSSLVQKAIDKLPLQHKAMIVMRDVQDLSYTDISILMKLPEGTVKSRINRARKNLRDIFLVSRELKDYINVK